MIFESLYSMNPANRNREPDKITAVLNCKIRKRHDRRPRKPVIGNFPMFNGTLKGLFNSDLRYLMYINEIFTNAKVMKAPKLVRLATSSKSPRKTNIMEENMVTRIARKGVPVLTLSFERILGKAPSFAIP